MSLLTRAETKAFLNIASTETAFDDAIDAYLPDLANRVHVICNRTFTVQPFIDIAYSNLFLRRQVYESRWDRDETLYIMPRVSATFDASSATVTVKDENFETAQFAAGQDIFIRDSYLNDGYFTVDSVSTSTLTITSTFSATFTDEATGATIYIGVVNWPAAIKPLAASLIQFDYQERGSWKDSEGGGYGIYGYPRSLLRSFLYYTSPAYGKRAAG